MSHPSNVCVEYDGSIRSLEHLIRKFLRECKKEGIVKEHLDQFVYETRGQKRRRLRREGRSRQNRDKKNKDSGQ